MISLFEKELIRMEQEVRDLKTSHAIPLGSLNFYRKTGSVTIQDFFSETVYVRVTVHDGEPGNPYVQTFVGKQGEASLWAPNEYQNITADGTIIQYVLDVDDGDYEVGVVSTSDFDLTVKVYQNGDWIGELPQEN